MICPGCGTANHPDAAYCNLCQKTFFPTGVSRFAGEATGGSPGPAAPVLRPVPMLSFSEAASRNVRMSRLLFLALFATFLAVGGGIGSAYGNVGYGVALALILYAILASTAYFTRSSLVLSIHGALGAVTTGLLERVNREELQGVIAHEMAHIKSRDTLYNICAAVLVGSIALLADMFLRGAPFRGRGRSGGGGRGNAAFLVLGFFLAILAPIAAKILQMSISRQREDHAAAGGAQFPRTTLR